MTLSVLHHVKSAVHDVVVLMELGVVLEDGFEGESSVELVHVVEQDAARFIVLAVHTIRNIIFIIVQIKANSIHILDQVVELMNCDIRVHPSLELILCLASKPDQAHEESVRQEHQYNYGHYQDDRYGTAAEAEASSELTLDGRDHHQEQDDEG